MTRENYFAFKKALKNVVCNVTKKGWYIIIEPNNKEESLVENFLPKYLDDAGIEYDFKKFYGIDIIHTEYGDLRWVGPFYKNILYKGCAVYTIMS